MRIYWVAFMFNANKSMYWIYGETNFCLFRFHTYTIDHIDSRLPSCELLSELNEVQPYADQQSSLQSSHFHVFEVQMDALYSNMKLILKLVQQSFSPGEYFSS
jgi:hypothetical protein